MTARDFPNNAPCAMLDICASAHYVLYGIEHGYAYIVYETDEGVQSYHKLKIRHTEYGSAYVFLHRTMLYMSEFYSI